MEIRSSHFRSRCRLAFGGLLAALACALPAHAQNDLPSTFPIINDGGSYTIRDPGTSGGGKDVYIGDDIGGNTLAISALGTLTGVFYGYIGNASGINAVEVTGLGASWNLDGSLSVGVYGSGNSLTINSGGQVAAAWGTSIGNDDQFGGSGNNSVRVSGTGSLLDNTINNMVVGNFGSGNNLTIDGGGQVINGDGIIGSGLALNGAIPSNNWVQVNGDGSIWNNSGNLHVGYQGSSNSLTIASGGLVISTTAHIGYDAIVGGGYGNTVLVTGGSIWSNASDMILGDLNGAGSNSLTVAGGGHVVVGGDLYVGSSGSSNNMTIASGGVVINNLGDIGNDANAYNNSVLVTGAGSIWTNNADLYVGFYGSFNSMAVASNAHVISSGNGSRIGYGISASNNAVLVTEGAIWTNSANLFVGVFGSYNRMVVTNGGQVFNNDSSIGDNATAAYNSALVSGANSTWSNNGLFHVGAFGSGNSLTVANGGKVIVVSDSFIGRLDSASNNSVLVSGNGSVWTNGGNLQVGGAGSSNSLAIVNSGRVVGGFGFIGYDAVSSNNRALVNGNGSIWGNTNGFAVGYGGSFNSLIITNGGAVISSTTGGVGILPGANYNSALISGGGSVWSNGSGFAMGLYGMGNRLTINDGGRLVTGDVVMGENAGANSNVIMVTDPGSVWSNLGSLNIGPATVGNQLIITNGGVVWTRGDLRLGTNASLLNSAMLCVGGDFENAATNQAINDFSGTNIFNGSSGGGSWVTQQVEVASVYAMPGLGRATNFYFGTFQVGDPITGSNAWVQLVDHQRNQPGGGVETFGASNLVIAQSQSVLDLNNRTSFVYSLSNAGTILQTNANPPNVLTRLDVVNTFTNAGTIIIGNGSVLQFSNAFINDSVVQFLTGGVLTNFVVAGVLTNSASGTIFGDGLIAAPIRNDGAITATGGTLRLSAGFDDGTLGNPVNAGVLQALGGSANLKVEQSFINTGTILASNAAAFTTTASAPVRNDNLIAIANQSTATFGAVVKNSGSGTIRVSNQSLLQFNTGLTNNGALVFGPAPNPSTAIITGILTLGNNGIISMTYTNDTLVMRGDLINGSTNNMEFDTRHGMLVFGGSTPLSSPGAATNAFEVASTNRGAALLGFDHNFAVGTLNVTNHIEFVNNVNNGGGSGTNEALYVDVLHLFDGATIKLSQLTVYVGMSFVDDNVSQTFVGDTINESNVHSYHGFNLSTHIFLDSGGQIVFVPEPSSGTLLLMGVGFAWRLRRRRSCQRWNPFQNQSPSRKSPRRSQNERLAP